MEYDIYTNPLITRYASKDMQHAFSDEKRFKLWRKLWIALAESEMELGLNVTQEQVEELKEYAEDIDFELAEKFEVEVLVMVGFLDGINESLKTPNPIEEMTEDTVVSLDYDTELLYKNMVEAKATWLYELPQWDAILTAEKRAELYKEQKASGTVRREAVKVYPNDPCPCGSGKKYKKCCGRNK